MTHENESGRPEGRGLPRRSVLKAGVAGGLAITGAAVATSATTAVAVAEDAKDPNLRRHFDVIVVGAGVAGVTATRELRAKGKRVLLLEARNRVGGRTWTDTWRGHMIERGGTWVDRLQPHVWRELNRYQLPIMADAGVVKSFMPTLTGFEELDPSVAYIRQGELFTKFFEDSTRIYPKPFSPLHRRDLVAQYDGFSLRDRLNQMKLTPADEILLTSWTSLYGGTSERGALTHIQQWWALSGGTFEAFHGVNTYRPKLGTVSIVNAMLAEAKPVLKLNSPVKSVVQNPGKVTVTTRAGEVFTAPEVIMAVPVNVWRNITFSPALPAAHREATTAGMGVTEERKLWIDLAKPSYRFVAESPEGRGDPFCYIGRFNDGDPVVAFTVDTTFNENDGDAVERAIRRIIPEAKVRDYVVTNFAKDEFALGTGGYRQPYQLIRLHEKLQQPHGRVKFAGSDIANGWNGYIDGAIEDGLRVAGSPTLSGPAAVAASAEERIFVPKVNRQSYRGLSVR
ncbi:FAD-dependent oxidoreductase [Saccharothrix sp. S26]|uniref:flavin monoamine oxidase family protein n=1 Tax=Saccharothrix sp. S26 TaxID=2907215 RepID=UPI001F2AC17A|nr:NAD(P)/FAD-dependent oxidoreductase [Saccharothrix sp. S26]MCE6999015.1 FAD-dependent oxidoreductase [Saccharothrix sp. S26]